MRYIVKDAKGKWQASYSKNIPAYSPKDPLKWAKQTAQHVGGIVYEVIEPNSPQYPTKTIELYNYTYKGYKLRDKKNKTFNKEDNKKKNTKKEMFGQKEEKHGL